MALIQAPINLLQTILNGLTRSNSPDRAMGTPPIFGGDMGRMTPTFPNMGVNPESPYGDLMNRTPTDSDALSRLRGIFSEMPRREDYNPSFWRRLGGMAAGIGAGEPMGMYGGTPVGWRSSPQAARAFLDRPYNEAMQDWETQFGGERQIASLETDINRENRIAEDAKLGRNLQERSLVRQEERDAQLAEQAAANNELKLLIAQMQAQGKIDQANAALERAREIEMLRQSGRMDQIEATAAIQRQLTELRAEITASQINQRGQVQKDVAAETQWETRQFFDPNTGKPLPPVQVNKVTGEERPMQTQGVLRTTPPGTSTSDDTLSPTQENQALRNKAMQIINQNPELKVYFETDNAGKPTGMLKPAPTWYQLGRSAEDYEKAKMLLLGDIPQPTRTGAPTAQPKGTVLMIGPDGNEYQVPADKVEDAKSKGMRVK